MHAHQYCAPANADSVRLESPTDLPYLGRLKHIGRLLSGKHVVQDGGGECRRGRRKAVEALREL